MTKTILFLSKGRSASSTRYRALQYFSLFKKHDITPTHQTVSGGIIPFLKALYFASKSDTVILLRKTFPSPMFWLLRKCSKKLIFDFDDAIFCNTDGSYSKTRMTRFQNTIKQSDHVFAGNHYLAEKALQLQKNTSVIPTSLDTTRYDQAIQRDDKHFTLVWIGSKSTSKYISKIIPEIEAAADNIPNLQLKIIADFKLSSNKVLINNIDWQASTEVAEICQSHIGLAPLPEDDWTKGKCALKVLQYMAASIPVITSPTGVNAYAIEDQVSGYILTDETNWATTIEKAYKQKANLKKMGASGKKRVSEEFDINIVFHKIVNLISS